MIYAVNQSYHACVESSKVTELSAKACSCKTKLVKKNSIEGIEIKHTATHQVKPCLFSPSDRETLRRKCNDTLLQP